MKTASCGVGTPRGTGSFLVVTGLRALLGVMVVALVASAAGASGGPIFTKAFDPPTIGPGRQTLRLVVEDRQRRLSTRKRRQRGNQAERRLLVLWAASELQLLELLGVEVRTFEPLQRDRGVERTAE